ncbi:TIR-like protein FxsC [Streptomyces sp. NPDC056367]|uniref:TIR-like protein FxsC n=1 Tax=unclassified Streptomyces TaxID=2593676 RepID=UPI0035DCAB31
MSGEGRRYGADRWIRDALRPFRDQWYDSDLRRFHAQLLVDRSPTMAVWRKDIDILTRALNDLRAFRVRTGDLPGIGDGEAWSPPGPVPPSEDRMLILVSDCASPQWRRPVWWQELYPQLQCSSAALINPLPPKLWRRVGLDLPAVRVGPPRSRSAGNADLPFRPPPLLDTLPGGGPEAPSWLPLPVLTLTGPALRQWAGTLTSRSSYEGCDALLVPGPAPWSPPRPPGPPPTAASLADSYLLLASPRAARLAVLCAAYGQLDLAQLRAMSWSFEPAATPADLAEILVSGLFAVAGDEPTTLRFRSGVREHLRSSLGVRDVRLLRERLPHYAERLAEGRRTVRPAPGPAVPPSAPPAVKPVAAPPRVDKGPGRVLSGRGEPYFFLSYAHTPRFGPGGPDPDMWVERLFRDLCGHVMAMTDLPAGYPVGFMDREMRSGEGWSERHAAALGGCRTFVPLLSPRYFASETCGKEWYAFADREVQHSAVTDQPVQAIVPALWVPVPPYQLPLPVERLQFDHNAFGGRYATDGLYGLIKLRSYAEHYERAVYELARRIVRVGENAAPAPARPVDHRSVPSAFGPAGSPAAGPSRTLQVTVAAASRRDLPKGRSPEYYGDTALDWNPYHPVSRRPIGYVAEDLARNLNYQVELRSFDDEIVFLDAKRPPDRPEILIVDRWAMEDEHRRRRLAAFDLENRPWVKVVVPWNRYDHQNRAREGELVRRMEESLPVLMGQGRVACRAAAQGVATMESFGQVLPQVVEAAAQQFLRHSKVHPHAAGTFPERPRLDGPMGMGGLPDPPLPPFPDDVRENPADDD